MKAFIKTGELIRALRMELGMTQQQLAQRLHVGDKAVSKWERGRRLAQKGQSLGPVSPAPISCGDDDVADIAAQLLEEI